MDVKLFFYEDDWKVSWKIFLALSLSLKTKSLKKSSESIRKLIYELSLMGLDDLRYLI
jgi:hypothetical protein